MHAMLVTARSAMGPVSVSVGRLKSCEGAPGAGVAAIVVDPPPSMLTACAAMKGKPGAPCGVRGSVNTPVAVAAARAHLGEDLCELCQGEAQLQLLHAVDGDEEEAAWQGRAG